VLGEDSHPVLAGEKPEAERVLAVAAVADRGRDLAVVVEIEAGRDAGVGRRDEDVRVLDRRAAPRPSVSWPRSR
jgi:hypothetical protein